MRVAMYAIAFDLNAKKLEAHYPKNVDRYDVEEKASSDIKAIFEKNGFVEYHTGLYFGEDNITSVQSVLLLKKTGQQLPWLKRCVTNIHLLRISESNDLTPALI